MHVNKTITINTLSLNVSLNMQSQSGNCPVKGVLLKLIQMPEDFG